MRCKICGSTLKPTRTDLPFKISDRTIVIIKELPVIQCGNCVEYQIDDQVFSRVEALLSAADRTTELEIVRFAA